jgi:hypothetical protein
MNDKMEEGRGKNRRKMRWPRDDRFAWTMDDERIDGRRKSAFGLEDGRGKEPRTMKRSTDDGRWKNRCVWMGSRRFGFRGHPRGRKMGILTPCKFQFTNTSHNRKRIFWFGTME